MMTHTFCKGSYVRLDTHFRDALLAIGVSQSWDGLLALRIGSITHDSDGILQADVILPWTPRNGDDVDWLTIPLIALELTDEDGDFISSMRVH